MELGVGRYVAWRSPIHREAVRKVLEPVGKRACQSPGLIVAWDLVM